MRPAVSGACAVSRQAIAPTGGRLAATAGQRKRNARARTPDAGYGAGGGYGGGAGGLLKTLPPRGAGRRGHGLGGRLSQAGTSVPQRPASRKQREVFVMVKVVVTPHARARIGERGGDTAVIRNAVNQAAPNLLAASLRSGDRRVALKIPSIPTIPIVEICPREYGVGLVIITVLPPCPTRLIPHPVV